MNSFLRFPKGPARGHFFSFPVNVLCVSDFRAALPMKFWKSKLGRRKPQLSLEILSLVQGMNSTITCVGIFYFSKHFHLTLIILCEGERASISISLPFILERCTDCPPCAFYCVHAWDRTMNETQSSSKGSSLVDSPHHQSVPGIFKISRHILREGNLKPTEGEQTSKCQTARNSRGSKATLTYFMSAMS